MLNEKFIKLRRHEDKGFFVWVDPSEIGAIQERTEVGAGRYTLILLKKGGGIIAVNETPQEIDELIEGKS